MVNQPSWRAYGALLAISALSALACYTFEDLGSEEYSWEHHQRQENNTSPNNNNVNNISTNNTKNNANNISPNNSPGSCASDWSNWARGEFLSYAPVELEQLVRPIYAGISLEVKDNRDIFVAHRFQSAQPPVAKGRVDWLSASASDRRILWKNTAQLGVEEGETSSPDVPTSVEAVTVGGSPRGAALVGVVGQRIGCDPLGMGTSKDEAFTWMASWDVLNNFFIPIELPQIQEDLCSQWPPQNLMSVDRPVTGDAAILAAPRERLLFRVMGDMGTGMPQELHWGAVASGGGERLTRGPVTSGTTNAPQRVLPMGEGPLVLAQGERGEWFIWNVEQNLHERTLLSSQIVDVTPLLGTEDEFILTTVQGGDVSLRKLSCTLEGFQEDRTTICAMSEPTVLEFGRSITAARAVHLPDPVSSSPLVALIVAEQRQPKDVLVARLIKLTGEELCVGTRRGPIVELPSRVNGPEIQELHVGVSRTTAPRMCVDVIAAVSHAEIGETAALSVGGFRLCQPR